MYPERSLAKGARKREEHTMQVMWDQRNASLKCTCLLGDRVCLDVVQLSERGEGNERRKA